MSSAGNATTTHTKLKEWHMLYSFMPLTVQPIEYPTAHKFTNLL